VNLRISEGQLRFRITQDELERLTTEGRLESSVDLGNLHFRYRIFIHESDTPMAFNIDEGSWNLKIGKSALAKFAASLPSREGIEQQVQLGTSPITLALEVDVRRNRKF